MSWDTLIEAALSPASRGRSSATPGGWDSLLGAAQPPRRQRAGGALNEDYVVSGLVERGLPEHVARGFAMNMQDESNLDPGINEANPIVEGSRGGFGLSQWTGPRRRQLESFAARRGVDVNDPEMQLDFLVHELQTTEKSAADAIMSTATPGEAGAAIVNKFLRPAESHRRRRAAKYLGAGTGAYGPREAAPAPTFDPGRLWLDLGDT